MPPRKQSALVSGDRARSSTTDRSETRDVNGSARAAALIGIGLMAAVDEIVFHQLLSWHHFYDRSTPAVGLLADGLLHSFELIAIVAGFFWYGDLRRRRALATVHAWAGFLLGAGGFQVADGILFHKVLRFHQIRYGVEILPYDLAWNLFGLVLVGLGIVAWRRARSPAYAHAR